MLITAPLVLLDAALRGMLEALFLVLIFVLWRERRRLLIARLGIALCLGLAIQVLSSTPLFEASLSRLWQAPFVAVSVGNAVLFWVLVRALFDDDFALRPVHLLAWAGTLLLSGVNCAVLGRGASNAFPWSLILVRLVPLLFASLAALAAIRHWRSDLVEQRRKLRIVIAAGGVAYTLATLALRLGHESGQWQAPASIADIATLLAVVAVAASRMLRLSPSDLLQSPQRSGPQHRSASEPASKPPDTVDDELAASLERLMGDDPVYRSGELTVASLAARLQVPEYRLRRLINQRLGHRNFNSYVNDLRLRDARTALADPARRALPVLTIALTSGFQSIGPFNRAFKAATGLTPTEYRKENMADS